MVGHPQRRSQHAPSEAGNEGSFPSSVTIVRDLLLWSREHGRHFPWRDWTDPYRLLTVEVLLRQTRAESVAAFIADFFRAYPTARDLASTGHAQLASTLQPLGLAEQRATQLRAMAAALQAEPVDLRLEALLTLPGIGRYSAGMVAAAAGDPDAVAVDTNIARLICRVFDLTPSHSEPRKSANIWAAASRLTACVSNPIELLWAALDLSAIHCVARSPRCQGCPLQGACAYGTSQAAIHA
jgi:A/G-specific adenine glycosylase